MSQYYKGEYRDKKRGINGNRRYNDDDYSRYPNEAQTPREDFSHHYGRRYNDNHWEKENPRRYENNYHRNNGVSGGQN